MRKSHLIYVDYKNNFLTLKRCAEYYGITVSSMKRIAEYFSHKTVYSDRFE